MLRHNSVTRSVVSLALLLGVALLPGRTVLAADAVAMVTDLQGPARLVDEGRQRPLVLLEYLRPGHEVRLGKNARVTLIYFQSGTQYVTGGEGTVRIAAAKPEVAGGATLAGSETRQAALAASARKDVVQGALVMKATPQPIQPLSPADTRALNARPVFVWKSSKAKPPFQITLTDANKQVVAQAEVKAMRFELPASITLADGARYSWRVEGRTSKGDPVVGEASFNVATAAERDKVNQARPAAGAAFSERVTYAAILDGMGFRDAARVEWRKLSAERKGDIRLRVRANQ